MNKLQTTLLAAAMTGLFATGAHAQSATSETQRDVNQQQRIEQGLKSGSLSTGEAARLEKGEARIDRMEANSMKDGNLSAVEKARIQNAQNRESAAIARDKSNGITGNPNSASSQRMQADVQRNLNQEQRINQGVRSGELTNRETARLERGQARTDRAEARAGANGRVGAGQQARIQNRENRQSNRIFRQKHDAQVR